MHTHKHKHNKCRSWEYTVWENFSMKERKVDKFRD